MFTCKLDTMYVNIYSFLYKQVLQFWYEVYTSTREPETAVDTANFYLWHNQFILIDGQPIYYDSRYNKKKLYVRDILRNGGHLLSKEEQEHRCHFRIKQMQYKSIVIVNPKKWLATVKERILKLKLNLPP